MGIVNNLLRRERRASAENVQLSPALQRESQTPLMLLLPDAGGVATYTLNSFPHARAAEYYLDLTLRGRLPEGAVLFWALTWEPEVDPGYSHAEPLVVIRDVRQQVVYPFSFSDIHGAFEFLRHEMKRGLDLSQVMVYWAVPVRVEVDFWGRSTIIPPTAPLLALHALRTTAAPSNDTSSAHEKVPDHSPHLVAPDRGDDPIGKPPASEKAARSRYLVEGDIAEVVEMVQQLSKRVRPAVEDDHRVVPLPRRSQADLNKRNGTTVDNSDTDSLIDFSNASQRLNEARTSRDAAVHAWSNICLAVDEALDVHVARQVAIKLAWNRLIRAIAEAAHARQRSRVYTVWHNGSVALAEAVDERKRQVAAIAMGTVAIGLRDGLHMAAVRRAAASGAWVNAATALAGAARCSARRNSMRRAWLNVSWTLEEAVYARALEQKASAIRAWSNATTAIAQAIAAQKAYEGALRAFWSAATSAFFDAAETSAARERMFRAAWTNAGYFFAEVTAECLRRDGLVAGWRNASVAVHQAGQAYVMLTKSRAAWRNITVALTEAVPVYRKRAALRAAWQNSSIALKEAIVAEAKLRIAQADLDKEVLQEVERAIKQAQHQMRRAARETADTRNIGAQANDQEPQTAFGLADANTRDDNADALGGGLFPFFRATQTRWEPTEEPFRGFHSPRGRFYRPNRDE